MTEKEPQIELEKNQQLELEKDPSAGVVNIIVEVKEKVDNVEKTKDTVEKVLLVNHVDKIGSLLMDNNYIQDLIKKLSINIDTATNVKIGNILTFLNTSVSGVLPLKSMLDNLQQVFEDGVLDLYDVPIIVKIITDLLNTNINAELLRNVKITDVGLVLKLLIYILIEFKIIQTDKIDNKTIFKIIDSSLDLLETSLKVSNVKFNCSCCPWFRK